MCGIVGSFGLSSEKFNGEHLANVQRILNAQSYRGPNHQAIEIISNSNTQLVFGHNRLSIIDLSSQSNQPMWDLSKQFCIIFNGMIYNYLELREELKQIGHSFLTNSDTEVILTAHKAWGNSAVERLNGMFAYALFDKKREELLLVRDRFGVKPLYFAIQNNHLYFASTSEELALILKLDPNFHYLARGIQYWCYEMQDTETAYQHLHLLSAGTIKQISYQNNQLDLNEVRYYRLNERILNLVDDLGQQSSSLLVEKVTNLLQEAVDLRLRSDVKLGISLSSGLDSSTIAALAQQSYPALTAFSYGDPFNAKTEGPNVVKLNNYLDLDLKFVIPTPNEMRDAFWQTLRVQDAPFPSFSVVAQYLVFRAAKEQGVKVLLGGQGGDEIFMGYRKFMLFYLQHLWANKNKLAALQYFLSLLPTLFSEFANIPRYLQSHYRYRARGTGRFYSMEKLNLNHDPMQSLCLRQIADITQFSLPTLLRYEDRNSMGNSIESRLPLLDYRLVELAVALNTSLKLNRGFGKYILRQIALQHLPQKICFARQKRGFDVLNQSWIKAGIGDEIRVCINENKKKLAEWLPENKSIHHYYSDQQLIHRPEILTEAITLCWLSKKMNHSLRRG